MGLGSGSDSLGGTGRGLLNPLLLESITFMARIQQLPSLVVNKIAAGEVIERPASVVKELLENAVDAGSRRIDLEVEQGGVDRICVVDDGCGIHPDDLHLAFATHATSKLRDAEELFEIDTFGFRGEALASVGGVAQVALQSRPHDLPAGAEIRCSGGELSAIEPWNGSPGTRIEVRHLFYNTPVRRKFLRAAATEMGHITEAFTRLALAECQPVQDQGLHLTLKNNGKVVYDIPATTPLLDRIGILFGSEVSKSMYLIDQQQGPLRLVGYVADPSCDRGTARMQYLFVNGRWIRDRSLQHAIQESYRGLLMVGRHPVAFLFLDLPPDHVDVNVHPTKSEVRFRDSQTLHHLIFTVLRERLRRENLTARLQPPQSTIRPGSPIESLGSLSGAPRRPVMTDSPDQPRPPIRSLPFPEIQTRPVVLTTPPIPESAVATAITAPVIPPVEAPQVLEAAPPSPPSPQSAALALPPQKILQLYDTYLVVETDVGMLLIDQHALHERILFEQFKERFRHGPLESQHLLIPEPVDLTQDQAAQILELKDSLAQLGLRVENFGRSTILVAGYPALLKNRTPREIFLAVVDYLVKHDRLPTREVLLGNLLSLMACHAAVRAGDRLTADQMSALVEQRHLADDTHHCPHGRPTALLFSRHDLEKQFGRI